MSSNERRRFLRAAGALALAGLIPPATAAAAELELQQPGTLRVAVYANFPPYSAAGKGVDIALGRALAEHLGLLPVRADAGTAGADSAAALLHENLRHAFRPIRIGSGLLTYQDQAKRQAFLRQWDAATRPSVEP